MEITWTQSMAVLLQVATGIGLASCAGLRAFLPLFVAGIAGRLDIIPLTRHFEWLESWPALTVFGAAIVAEILGDKFPVVDNFLDAVQGFVKPIAGTIVMASVQTELSPLTAAVLGLIVGGTTAGAVHLGKAKLRLASTVTTVGTANPVLSVAEDAAALAGSVAAILVPLLVFLLLLLMVGAVWMVLRHRRRRAAVPG